MDATRPSLTGTRVLVTGGAGFVGRAVVTGLARAGAEVAVLDREAAAVPGAGRVVAGEVSDDEVLVKALTPTPDAVVHLAAATSVLASTRAPVATYESNVAGTQRLLEQARRAGVRRLVMASTNAVVGDVGHAVLHEGMPLAPLTPYGATKAAAEMLLAGYAGAYGLSTCALRFTNIYGPGMSGKDSIVARLLRAALAGGGIQIYGDGRQRRDYVHVDDVVAAVLAATTRTCTGPVIIGSGRSVTVLELVDAARRVTGCPLPAEHVAARRGEMPAVIVDLSRAAGVLGYRPAIGLVEGLRGAWQAVRFELRGPFGPRRVG